MQQQGSWWRPGNAEEAVVGFLKQTSRGRITLTLAGGLGDDDWHGETMPEWDILHGNTAAGKLTLLSCRTVSERRRGEKLRKQEIIAQWALLGIHLEHVGQEIFDELEIEIENLHQLCQTSNKPYEPGPRPRTMNSFSHKHYLIRLNRKVRGSNWHKQRRGYFQTKTQSTSVTVKTSEKVAISDLLETLRPLQDLVTFAAQEPCGIISLNASACTAGRRHDIQILFHGIAKVKPKEKASVNFLFGFADLSFARLGRKWMQLFDEYSIPFNMTLGLMYWKSGPLETRIVTAVTAAEALHRKMRPIRGLTSSDHAKILAALNDLDPTLRRWAKDRVGRNDPSLKERLIDLVKQNDPVATAEILPDVERWATLAKKHRNDVAHGLRLTNDDQVEEALAVIVATSAIVALTMLSQLKVPSTQIAWAAQHHPQFRFARRHARKNLQPVKPPTSTRKRRKRSDPQSEV